MAAVFPFPLLFIPLAFVAVLLWFGVSYKRGWAVLARAYPAGQPFPGRLLAFQNGSMGGLGFQNSLEIGADERGLSLSVPFSVGPLFPPLMIPWDAITTAPKNGPIVNSMLFQVHCMPPVTLRVAESLGRQILSVKPNKEAP